MSTLSQFAGGKLKPVSIVNAHSTTIQTPGTNDPADWSTNTPLVKVVNSGAVVASTHKQILNITGKGALSYLGIRGVDATSRLHGVTITIDGVVAFNGTSAAMTSTKVISLLGMLALYANGSGSGVQEVPIFFDQSLIVTYASSVTETDKSQIGYIYYLR